LPNDDLTTTLPSVPVSTYLSASAAGSVDEFAAHTIFLRLSNALRSPLVRRWCVAEWFYSTVDLPFFAHNEFVAHIDALGPPYADLANNGLTRAEWTAIRRRIGRPRRLSPAFLRQERVRLAAHRRAIVTMRQTGSLDDAALAVLRHVRLPPPLAARQRVVVADFVNTRLTTGSILARTVDCSGYMVRFDDKSAEDQLVPAHAVMAYGDRAPVAGQPQRFAYAPIQSTLTRSLGKVALPTPASDTAVAATGGSSGGAAAATTVAAGGGGGGGGAAGGDAGENAARRRHGADKVRPLADLLYLLRRKELLLHELRHMNDLAEIAVAEEAAADDDDDNNNNDEVKEKPRATKTVEFDVRFRHEYAWLLAQLNQTDALLTPALSALESHPMRQRGSGKTRAANQSSWYAPLGAACSARANDVAQRALNALAAAGEGAFEPDAAVVDLVAAAVSLLLHVVYCCESTMPQNETTLALFAASTALRPHVAANQATFARIEEQLNRFKRAAFTTPLPPPAYREHPPARVPLLNVMASPQPAPIKRKSAQQQ
jgi:hypothetical protein